MTTGKGMIAKRLRMVLDFEVAVEELTDESLHEYYRRLKGYEELSGDAEMWANVTRQLRLQRALLKDEEALGRFITMVVVDEVDSRLDSRLGEVFGVGGMWGEEEILGPVISRLDEEDANFYRELIESELLHENTEALNRAFRVVWRRATLEEVRPVAESMIEDGDESDKFT
jgi:hypothetical protein